MKKLFTLLFVAIANLASAQFTTINPDTVCYQTNGSIYNVTNTAGYTYTWTVAAPGVITSGQGTNQIGVNWSNANPGLITNAVTVTASAPGGCQSASVTVNVFILQVNPVITAIGPFCAGAPCVNLSATPIGGIWSGTNVSNNQFCPTTSGTYTITYTITQSGCTGTATTTVVVNPIPVLSPISHN